MENCKANKFSKTTIVIRFKFIQVCQSVPPFVFAVLWFTLSFHVLPSSYFCVSLSLAAVPTAWVLINLMS